MFGLNPEQVTGTIRQFLPFFSGIATALGVTWFDGVASAVLATVGPLMGLASLVWSLTNKKEANILLSAKAVPGVQNINLNNTAQGRALEHATLTVPGIAVDHTPEVTPVQ